MKSKKSVLLLLLAGILLCGLAACRSHDDAAEETEVGADEARVYFLFTLDTSTGTSMRRAPKSNAEVFDEFYPKIQSGELVAGTYELTLTDVGSGAVCNFSGAWGSQNCVTLRTGTYHVTGTSRAEGEWLQDRCSFTFDETIDIKPGSSAVTLHADYDCFLLIFGGADLRSLQNNSGTSTQPFFTFGDYRYAFVNTSLCAESARDKACIEGEYTSGTAFRIMTGKLAFETGKYYVYNTATGGFDVPPMEEGDETGGKDDEPNTPDNPDTPVDEVAIDMVSVPAGTFLMGSADDDADAQADERPQHEVSVAAFSIGRYEVTQALWKQVMGTNPAYFQGTKVASANLQRPVENVSKEDAEQFIDKLNSLTGRHFRLPSEAEWEFAARGGQTSTLRYAGSNDVGAVAWYKENAGSVTHPVDDASKQPNGLGISGMSGNVWEWTSTPRTDSYAPDAPVTAGSYVVRGGSFQNAANSCRVAFRNFYKSTDRRNFIGLRLAEDGK